MKLQTLLTTLLCSGALAFVPADTAEAQRSRDSRQSKPEILFPEAGREAPKQGSSRFGTKLDKAYKLIEKEKYAEAIAAAEAIANNERAGPYERSRAYYIAGYATQQTDTESVSKTIDYLTRAIESNGLDNNMHYQLMQQVAQLHVAEEQYDHAIRYIDR
ncbi:MAG TPA: hypothetical protein VFY12_10850, partial [Arenimonas sp.]|nr:hypothetical protein [Arenimonas sp.]